MSDEKGWMERTKRAAAREYKKAVESGEVTADQLELAVRRFRDEVDALPPWIQALMPTPARFLREKMYRIVLGDTALSHRAVRRRRPARVRDQQEPEAPASE
jgi:hypothetical protein